MDKKVIFFDVDGTLIDRTADIQQATKKTKEIINRMIEKGHVPVVSTGRPLCMIKEDIRSLGFKGYVSSGGNYVMINDEVVYTKEMDRTLLMKAFHDAYDLGLALYLENNEKCFVSPRIEHHIQDFMTRCGREVFEITDDIEGQVIHKANLLWNNKESFNRFYDLYKNEFNFSIFAGNNGSTDIIPIDSSKAVGAKKVLEALNLTTKDAYAIGDGRNDLEILQFVDYGIAMGNASADVKEVAWKITKSVENEGIYEVFKDMEWMK